MNNGESARTMMLTRVVPAACALLVLASGCRINGLAFRADTRVEFVAPENRAEVTLPFDVRWTVEDFRPVGADGSQSDDAGFFAVLLDVSPMPPGEGLAYFARDDDTCDAQSGCPDEAYLADRRIYTTTNTTFRVDALADTRPSDRPEATDDHDITIVLLNGKGERIGESAFRRTVIIDRGQGAQT